MKAIRTDEPGEPREDPRRLARMVIVAAFAEAWTAKPEQAGLAVGAEVAERLGSDLSAERVLWIAVADLEGASRIPDLQPAHDLALQHLARMMRGVDQSPTR